MKVRGINIVIKPDGSIQIVYTGFKGDACFEEAKRLYDVLRALGVDVEIVKTEKTSEAYNTTRASSKVVNHV